MSEAENDSSSLNPKLGDIPKEFYSESTGQPFKHCNVCGTYLLNAETSYVVEKAVKRYLKYNHHDIIFEFAICLDCQLEMYEKLSTESRQRMEEFMAMRASILSRVIVFNITKDKNVNSWIGECVVTKKTISELNEYQILATFQGDKMNFEAPPMMFSMEAIDEMVQLFSNSSLDVLNDFKDRITDMPPELHKLFKESKFVVI